VTGKNASPLDVTGKYISQNQEGTGLGWTISYNYEEVFVNSVSSGLLSKNINVKIYRTITWPVVLYRYETCSLTLREECRVRVFEKRMVRNIFGTKREDIAGEWEKKTT